MIEENETKSLIGQRDDVQVAHGVPHLARIRRARHGRHDHLPLDPAHAHASRITGDSAPHTVNIVCAQTPIFTPALSLDNLILLLLSTPVQVSWSSRRMISWGRFIIELGSGVRWSLLLHSRVEGSATWRCAERGGAEARSIIDFLESSIPQA